MGNARVALPRGLLAFMLAVVAWGAAHASDVLPRLTRDGASVQLEVDGKPFLLLAGEIHNSSASSTAYMQPIWDRLAALHLNTVIGTVSWELTEPEQGQFDFSLVDDQIEQARLRDLHLVLIWFASYKNAESRYVPAWIRKDVTTYPRVVEAPDTSGRFKSRYRGLSTVQISPFSDNLLTADSHAFAMLMHHLRERDPNHTVIMLQVENEVGLLGDSRDRSTLAESAWRKQVPAELLMYMKSHDTTLRPELTTLWGRQNKRTRGTWAEVFGTDWEADEVFMAWQFGRFVNKVAEAGKKELAIPMYTNAWLGPQPGADIAGLYPSGGPVARMMDVWKAAAPAIDFLAPDIYVDDVKGTYSNYTRADNPLFPPETQPIVGSLFQAIGMPSSLGYSIFGIEDVPTDGQIAEAYYWLKPAIPEILEARAKGGVRGFALGPNEVERFQLGAWDVAVSGSLDAMKKYMLDAGMAAPEDHRASKPEGRGLFAPVLTDKRPSGLIIETGPNQFLMLGSGFSANFSRSGTRGAPVEIESIEEGRFVDGHWTPGRRLNGDEQHNPIPIDAVAAVRVKFVQR